MRILALVAVLGLTTVPLVAQGAPRWLVLVHHTRIETRGAWRVDDQRVYFTDASGKMYWVEIQQIDLDATRKANEEQPKAPVIKITDDNLARQDWTAMNRQADQLQAETTAKKSADAAKAARTRAALQEIGKAFDRMEAELKCAETYKEKSLAYELCMQRASRDN